MTKWRTIDDDIQINASNFLDFKNKNSKEITPAFYYFFHMNGG